MLVTLCCETVLAAVLRQLWVHPPTLSKSLHYFRKLLTFQTFGLLICKTGNMQPIFNAIRRI